MVLEQLSNFRESCPVFRIKERSVDEIESEASDFAHRFASSFISEVPQLDMIRQEDATIIRLPKGARLRAYHNSGAFIIKQRLGPLENLITDTINKEVLTERVVKAKGQIFDIEKFHGDDEKLEFERLWQIKATAVTRNGKKGDIVLCRVIGAFRRFIHDLPVWGGASAYVMLAGNNIIDSAGLDYRQCIKDPIDHVEIIEPQVAAESIIKKLAEEIGRSNLNSYSPEMFSLGYFSLPKRRKQVFMQPMYTAVFKAIDQMNPGRLVVIPALEAPYESITMLKREQTEMKRQI
jgi:hypothetical protein